MSESVIVPAGNNTQPAPEATQVGELFYYPYGITSPKELTTLELYLEAFRTNPPESQGGRGKPYYFWQIVDILWGSGAITAKKFFKHPWAERMVELLCVYDYLGVHGAGSCVSGDTRILNPITGEQPTIQELFETKRETTVMTMYGPAMAGIPFIKGEEELFRVSLRNGISFVCTLGHQVLTERGFVRVSSLRPGQSVLGYDAAPRRSTLDTFRSIRVGDALNFLRTTEGYQENYFSYSRRDGEQPHSEGGPSQSLTPLQCGAQERMEYAFFGLDDLAHRVTHSHPYQLASSGSSRGSSVPCCNWETLLSLRSFLKIHPHEFLLSQQREQFDQEKLQPFPFQKHGHDSFHMQKVFSSENCMVSAVPVQAITSIGKAIYYDLKVPIFHHYFAEGAIHHNSGKTDTAAVWGIINWMADPMNTLVLATSTSLKDSRKRIWGSIIEYFQAIPDVGRIGTLADSIGQIRCVTNDDTVASDKRGIALIPGEKKKEREAIGKIIGMKNHRIILLADELPELSEALISAAQSNLCLNPHFQMLGIGNFNSIYDPLGVFVTPKAGWGSISVNDEEWETKDGYCLRFDGMKSPNVLAGKEIYPRIYSAKNLAEHEKRYGHNSALFWRMCRSFPCPEGEKNCIYADADFIKGDAHGKAEWLSQPIPAATADPAFTNDGDDFSVCYGMFGKNKNGLPTLQIEKMDKLKEDMTLTQAGEARDLQTARQLADKVSQFGVSRKHLGIDSSGPGGLAFGSILSIFWGHSYLPICFQEKASDLAISMNDPRKGHEAFFNLSSELWWMGKEFIRAGQIKGLPQDVARQLKMRQFDSVKSGDFLKVKIESKPDMKKRTGESPDQADSFLMLVYLCRFIFGFSPGTINMPGFLRREKPDQSWMTRVRKAHEVYEEQFQ